MFLIRAGLKNKKKIFVNKNTIPLKSSLTRIEKVKSYNGIVNKFYHYDVFVEVDKRVIIEQDIQKIEVEISKRSLSEINNRETMLEGIDTNSPRLVNLVANNAQKLRMDTTINKYKKLNIRKIGEISNDDVYNSKIASKIKKFNLPDSKAFPGIKKRYVLRKKSKSTKQTNKKFFGRKSANYLKVHQKQGQKLKKLRNSASKFQKKYSKLIVSGQDPTGIILKNIKNNTKQSSFNFLKGRQPRLRKPSAYARKNILNNVLLNKIENDTDPNANLANDDLELILENENTRNAVLKQSIKISEKHFLQLKKSNLRLIFIAKNRKNVSIDVTEGFLNHFEEKKRLLFPNFDFEIEANKNARNKITLTIKNNDTKERKFNVYALKGSGYIPYTHQKFKKMISAVLVKPKQQVTLFRKTKAFNANRSTFFRVNIVHDGIEYANTRYASIISKSKQSKVFYGGVIAKSGNEKITITVVNIPSATKRVQIVKRNLSKNESVFVPLKKINLNTKMLMNDPGILIKSNSKNNLVFEDIDVEKNNVYEYKINIFDDNGFEQISAHGFIERYVEKKNILNVVTNMRAINQTAVSTTYNLRGSIKKIQTAADKVFNDLFGNFYDLFKDDLSQVRDLNTLSYNILFEMYKKETGELVLIDDISIDKNNSFNKQIEVDNAFDYFIKITPRAIPPAEIIAKINNSLPFFSKKQRFLPVSSFNTAAIKKRIKNSNLRIVSYVGNKYSDKSNRLNSKIRNRNEELQSTNYDLYFDGETGDNLYMSIMGNPSENLSKDSATAVLLEGNVKHIKKNILKTQNNIHLELGEEKYMASFTVQGIGRQLDFFTMFYKENGNTVTDGLACLPSDSSNINRVNYIFTIPNAYGKIEFYAQPVTKSGRILNPVIIGSILKDDRGIQ